MANAGQGEREDFPEIAALPARYPGHDPPAIAALQAASLAERMCLGLQRLRRAPPQPAGRTVPPAPSSALPQCSWRPLSPRALLAGAALHSARRLFPAPGGPGRAAGLCEELGARGPLPQRSFEGCPAPARSEAGRSWWRPDGACLPACHPRTGGCHPLLSPVWRGRVREGEGERWRPGPEPSAPKGTGRRWAPRPSPLAGPAVASRLCQQQAVGLGRPAWRGQGLTGSAAEGELRLHVL